MMEKLFAAATDSLKTNQDYFQLIENNTLYFSGIVIADGIGSHYKSELASRFCCDKLKNILELKDESNFDIKDVFRDVQVGLIEFAKSSNDIVFNDLNLKQSLGTTLIVVLETKTEYIIAYSGNGCIWHIDGRFDSLNSR